MSVFQSDFLLEDADEWRAECWDMIRERPGSAFLLSDKDELNGLCSVFQRTGETAMRMSRWDVPVENQAMADARLSIFSGLPIRHKNIICQPLIGSIRLDVSIWQGVELVVAGGESDKNARPLDYEWILSLREQCIRARNTFRIQTVRNTLYQGRENVHIGGP